MLYLPLESRALAQSAGTNFPTSVGKKRNQTNTSKRDFKIDVNPLKEMVLPCQLPNYPGGAAWLQGYSPGLDFKAEILHRPQLLGQCETQVVNGIIVQNRGLISSDLISNNACCRSEGGHPKIISFSVGATGLCYFRGCYGTPNAGYSLLRGHQRKLWSQSLISEHTGLITHCFQQYWNKSGHCNEIHKVILV